MKSLRWVGFSLALLALAFLGVFVLWPSSTLAWNSHVLSSALRDSKSVQVIEFVTVSGHEKVLQSVSASAEQIEQLRFATRPTFVLAVPGSVKPCMDPHHRVEILGSNGEARNFEVCFLCIDFSLDRGAIYRLPPDWISPLRQFFNLCGMPPRSLDEYRKLGTENENG